MALLREFTAALLDRHGAAVEPIEPEGLEVLAPPPVRAVLDVPEMARLGFGTELPAGARRVGLEGDWLERFGLLLGDRGQWVERQAPPSEVPPPGDAERLLSHGLVLDNAVARFRGQEARWTRCLILAFRYTALSDEKREGLLWLGFNLGTGATLGELVARLRAALAEAPWLPVDPERRARAGPGWDAPVLEARLRPLLAHRVRQELAPFLRAMRRRLERDHGRLYAYHDDLRAQALKKLADLAEVTGDKADADRRRETQRVAAIEQDYRAKLDDLRHNYALNLTVAWVQALEVLVPVQRLALLVRRRKGERLIHLDWHPLARQMEPPPCDWGLGLDRVRQVCDDRLHLTEPAGQAPCPACGKPFCRACHPKTCPRCGAPAAVAVSPSIEDL